MFDDILAWAQEEVPKYVANAHGWIIDNNSVVALFTLASIIVVLLWFANRERNASTSVRKALIAKLRGKKMTGQAREAEVRVLISDGVTDVLEDLLVRGKITQEEQLTWYDRFGNLLDLRDLISAKRLTLKQELRMSRKKREAREKSGKPIERIPIPEIPSTPKNGFDALVKRVKPDASAA